MTETRPPYLFNPETVESRISPLPRTAKLIHEKKRVGEQSAAFPGLQKTEREILRILGRAGLYDHLDELLYALEHALENGWDAHQLGARDRDEFASLISDLQVAEHFLLRGFTIGSPVGLNISGPKPDLYICKSNAGAIVEVFRPRELPAFHNFLTDVSRILMEADIALDYAATVSLDYVSDENGRFGSPWHPIDLDEALTPIVNEALVRVATRITALQPVAHTLIVEEFETRNLSLTIALKDVRASGGDEPEREVCNGLSFGGYDPVGMLGRLMKPINVKAKRRQAGDRGDRARVLVCDVSATVVAPHLEEQHRQESYAEILSELHPQIEQDYDVIALCEQRGWGKELRLHFCVCDNAYESTVGEMFGAFRNL